VLRTRPIKACLPVDIAPASKEGTYDAVLGLKDRWPNGSTLRVYFYPEVKSSMASRCLAKMQEWSQYANIKFAKEKNIDNSDLRVTFRKGGSWSYLGNQAKLKPGEPTMNFGWLTDKSEQQEFDRVVLHETGHSLGLQHEHQHPTNTIPWVEDKVIEYYQQQGWTAAMTKQQVLTKTPKAQTQYSEYDRDSIMEYPIPKELVSDKSYAVGWNTRLSRTDKQFIGEVYPFDGKGPSRSGKRRKRGGSSSSSSSSADYSDDDDFGDDYSGDDDFDDDY
jgi:hypothetical protein